MMSDSLKLVWECGTEISLIEILSRHIGEPFALGWDSLYEQWPALATIEKILGYGFEWNHFAEDETFMTFYSKVRFVYEAGTGEDGISETDAITERTEIVRLEVILWTDGVSPGMH